jgi:hypothetical protein
VCFMYTFSELYWTPLLGRWIKETLHGTFAQEFSKIE